MKNTLEHEQDLMRNRMKRQRRGAALYTPSGRKSYKRKEYQSELPPSENALEKQVKEFLVRQGCRVLRSGWPDYLVFKDGKPLLVEVKSTKDRLSAQQREMHAALKSLGLEVIVVKPEVDILHRVFGVEQ